MKKINYKECIKNYKKENYYLLDLSYIKNHDEINKIINHDTFNHMKKNVCMLCMNELELKETLVPLDEFNKLSTIDLSFNKLRKLLKLPVKLKELIINDNKITKLTDDIKELNVLNCSNNRLEQIYYSKYLKHLNIKNNPILEICSLNNLVNLDISNTKIKTLPEFPNLELLDISNTQIKKLLKYPKLKDLFADNSSLEDINEINTLKEASLVNTNVSKIRFNPDLEILKYNNTDMRISEKFTVLYIKCDTKKNIMTMVFNNKL
jgi:hypothetical protein